LIIYYAIFSGFMSILAFWRRYRIVVIFPTLAISSIVADYAYTRKWKQQQRLANVSQVQ
ncbi:uncharacterized protein LOC135715641, partial [Ochlerotatus camptorhynchus]|uniref:uncharacterized protein LOC135715641 n=1 Tax=Ochlerotatus camptorhynchus TaxID=644619 RepID=UPI0031DF328C